MLSMGIGALFVRGKIEERPVTSLQVVELCLAILGAGSIVLLFFLNWLGTPRLVFFLVAHLLIILIGVLTGAEIPLLMEIRKKQKSDTEASVLGIDYIGAFLGTIVFAFYLYPVVGLVKACFLVALANSITGVLLISQHRQVSEAESKCFITMLLSQSLLTICLAFCLYKSTQISEFLTQMYLA